MSVRSFWIFASPLVLVVLLFFQATSVVVHGFPRAPMPDKPFWERKERVFNKMVEERAIYVSVKTAKSKTPKLKKLKILGAGVISRPRKQAWEKLIQFDKWSGIHEAIRVSRWTPATRRLFLHMEAFDYHAKMILQVESERKDAVDWIHMKVVQGSFEGMTVAFRLKDAKSRSTEVAMTAHYEFEKLPMPQFFVVFGLEVVFQKIAGKMRLFVEQDESIQPEDAL